jgi:hypothetical protein
VQPAISPAGRHNGATAGRRRRRGLALTNFAIKKQTIDLKGINLHIEQQLKAPWRRHAAVETFCYLSADIHGNSAKDIGDK